MLSASCLGVGAAKADPLSVYGPIPGFERGLGPYRELPPPHYYGKVPFAVMGPPPWEMGRVSPDAVFDALERAGYSQFGAMADRRDRYRLRAVNRYGDLVALEISVYTGRIERELVLSERRRPAHQRPPAVHAQPTPPAAAPNGGDPLVVY